MNSKRSRDWRGNSRPAPQASNGSRAGAPNPSGSKTPIFEARTPRDERPRDDRPRNDRPRDARGQRPRAQTTPPKPQFRAAQSAPPKPQMRTAQTAPLKPQFRAAQTAPPKPQFRAAQTAPPKPQFRAAQTAPPKPQFRAAQTAPPKPQFRTAQTAPPVEPGALEKSAFAALGLAAPLVRAVLAEGYDKPTTIQAEVIPHVLAGRDVLACGQTGTGKTAAFVLPILERLARSAAAGPGIRVLILTPTRELAAQIDERIDAYGRYLNLRHAVVYGGVSQFGQERALSRKPAILVATPGRLLDLMRQGIVSLENVSELVLDEADRMLDMGFVRDVRTVCAATSAERRTLLFSATFSNEIAKLAKTLLKDPVSVNVSPATTTAVTVAQSVVFVARAEKRALLERLLGDQRVERALVFTSTKRGANRLAEQLVRAGIESEAIHGNKSQGARQRALEAFRRGRSRVLVATDVASRGIDVDGISHVINFELPNVPESYVHRIGRTGRAGASGKAISFCDPAERANLAQIERLIRCRLSVASGPSLLE
jgi:ATP-dependent RNA helicase RhlE